MEIAIIIALLGMVVAIVAIVVLTRKIKKQAAAIDKIQINLERETREVNSIIA
jgi:biopolymer transport protein ExbB/TolQ